MKWSYNFLDSSICLPEEDVEWNIYWPLTQKGMVVKQKCPGGADSVGMHYNFKL